MGLLSANWLNSGAGGWRARLLPGLAVLVFLVNAAEAQTPIASPPTPRPADPILLWPNSAPGALGTDPEKDVPTITPYWPAADKATGAAMIICPGGSYSHLAPHEGKDYALWLNQLGIAGFVLKYRLGSNNYRYPAMLNDIQRAIRQVRFHAAEWKLDPAKIGVMGSSAGGHVCSLAVTHFDGGVSDPADPIDQVSSRPDLGIFCYALITMGPKTHAVSKANLLGPNPSDSLVQDTSSELQVTRATPPCFIWHTFPDNNVPMANSLLFANALTEKGVSMELHIYAKGGHGQGLGVRPYDPATTDPAKLLPWTQDLVRWLKAQGFLR